MMKAVLVLAICFSSLVSAQPLTDRPLPLQFDQEQWRQIYLEIRDNREFHPAQFYNLPPAGSRKAEFIHYYQSVMEPRARTSSMIWRRYKGLKLLLDSALASSPEEEAQWKHELDEVLAQASALETDPQVKAEVLKFGQLARGLSGHLPEAARREAKEIELATFAPELASLAAERYQLSEAIDQIANNLPENALAREADQQLNRELDRFYKGEISFHDASQSLERLSLQSSGQVGQALITSAGEKLQRMAVVMSLLAKSKDFPTWADYAVATQATAHAEGLKTSQDLLQFLYGLLDETAPVARRVYEEGARRNGLTLETLRPGAQYLLLPPSDFHLYGYFPKENIEALCRTTMAQCGFPESLTRRVMVDAFPRDGKQNHAYMMPARTSGIHQEQINGSTLNIDIPDVTGTGWTLPVTAIVQNFDDDDVNNARTMFHENGHGLEYASQRIEVSFPRAYGYAETHSTTMEQFLEDRDFLLANARTRDGTAATPELVDKYLSEKAIANLMGFRSNVMQAIFDIELWQYDYSLTGAATIWDRAIEITARLRERTRFVRLPADLLRPVGLGNFRTSHYYSGDVRYFGYVLAEVSAGMVTDRVLDQVERTSGRRSLYNQPSIANILMPLYRNGLREQFPNSIESFTGKRFAPSEFARSLVQKAEAALARVSCSELLEPPHPVVAAK